MSVIGKEVVSKKTGSRGTIDKIENGKLYVGFVTGNSIPVDIDILNMDQDVYDETISELKNSKVNTSVKGASKSKKIKTSYVHSTIRELDAEQKIEFDTNYHVLNDCFGYGATVYRKAVYLINDEFKAWFPVLVDNINCAPAANNCTNVISADWNHLIYEDHRNDTDHSDSPEKILVFAREPHNGPVMFRGVFVEDTSKSANKHYEFNRIGTKIKLDGNPVDTVSYM